MYKLLPVVLCFILSAHLAFGQRDFKPGYILTNSNDTIKGLIDLKANFLNSRQCDFTANGVTELKTYFPGDIKGYRIENEKYYVSREVDIDSVPVKVFLEYLVDGIADLYYLNQADHQYYFLEKNNEMYRLTNEEREIKYTPVSIVQARKFGANETYIQRSNKYIGMLSIAFSDCPELKDQIYNTGFNYKQLINVTKDYHNKVCSDYECIDYSKSTKSVVYFEPIIGIIHSVIGLRTSSQKANNTSYLIGVNFRVRPLQSHYVWNLLIGANYSENGFKEVYYHDLEGFNHNVQVKFDCSVIRFPLSIEYTFPTGNLRPFIGATYTNALMVNAIYEVVPVYEFQSGTIIYGNPYNVSHRTLQYGLGAGLGLKYIRNDRSYGIIKCEFEHMGSYTNLNAFFDYMNTNSYIISAGYGFRL